MSSVLVKRDWGTLEASVGFDMQPLGVSLQPELRETLFGGQEPVSHVLEECLFPSFYLTARNPSAVPHELISGHVLPET